MTNALHDRRLAPHTMSVPDVLKALKVRADEGLSAREVRKRQLHYGLNEIPIAKRNRVLKLLLDRFRDMLVIILIIAGIVSIVLGHVGDAIIIGVAIAIDASLSFAQVWRTEQTLAKMKQRVADTITVLRNGSTKTIPSKELAVGDIIEFRAGEKVPVDARLIRAQGLFTQEAVLTGESGDVSKQTARLSARAPVSNQSNMIFAGTAVVNGSGAAVVTRVGVQTEFGKIAQMLRDEPSPASPLRRKLQQSGLRAGWVIIAAVMLLAIIGLIQGQGILETGRTAITLIVSAIPEDLTMILTIALTVGVARILRQGGVVRKLSSGETLGAATVICTDKTGTLTEGKMKASALSFLQGDEIIAPTKPRKLWQQLALIGLALANDAHKSGKKSTEYVGSATERTALSFVESMGWNQQELRAQWQTRDSIPFDPHWKYRALLVAHPTEATQTLFVTGAPDVLLQLSSHALNGQSEHILLSSQRRFELGQKIEALAGQGQRLIAVAVRRHLHQARITNQDVRQLVFLAVLSITDPVRSDIQASIAETLSAGVAIKLITGDHSATAQAVARQVGLPAQKETILEGETLQQLSDQELSVQIKDTLIFARVEPLDKQRIVRVLQQNNEVVAMTGDGVNDAVALKSADIGVAMGSGSDIARDAADLVLLDNSFKTIVAAIKEGRVLRDNIRKVIAFLLATNAAEVAIFFASIIAGLPLPLLPAQILWINLVTDGTSDIALSLEPAEDDVMQRRPEHPQAPLLGHRLLAHIVLAGLVMTIGTMSLFWYLLEVAGQDLTYARTMAFTFLSVASLLSVWSFRSPKYSLWRRGLWQNPWIAISASFSLGLHALAIYLPGLQSFFGTVPLNSQDWLIIIGLATTTTLIIDLRKYIIKIPSVNAQLPLSRLPSSASKYPLQRAVSPSET
jgi:P-type Ca2+ transporter type 2C